MKRDYIEFQERSAALAFFITFRCYGTWFHGDERGSVDRRFSNCYGETKIEPNKRLEIAESRQAKAPPFILAPNMRTLVEKAIRDLCIVREYSLYALNVRTNHVHLVVGNSGKVERMMDSFKAFSTKALKTSSAIPPDFKPWSRHGSTRYLWTEKHIEAAVDYVVNGQDGGSVEFEREKKLS